MKKLTLALAGLALAATAAFAASPAEESEALMKERGGLVGGLTKVAKGETAFDAAAVLTQLQALQANAEKGTDIAKYWPSKDQASDEAAPKIWETPDDYKAHADKYKADVDAAVAAPPADVAALQTSMGAITKNCGACHELYRIKKD